ncbi:SDR family NAD(P)-dependent oxidoreductase [Dactylosporangium sp. NPDC005572]|uniref:SDR family NAD(P)-dependent oxidoreductase n=1 Tax=Dactylosporangium sp. NPDC005572 TaxID=3156889 RepID=UPI0033A40916
MELTGRRIIVTGGAQGIGGTLVTAYARAGAIVGALDIKADEGCKTAEQASEAGPGSAYFYQCNVADSDSVRSAFDAFSEVAGGLDVLVHAAAIEMVGPAEDITVEDWDRVFAVNTRGTMLTNQAAFRLLRDGGGAILNFASGAGVRGYAQHGQYAASKGAVLSWTRTVAYEWGRYGITVNSICPGMRTPMYQATRDHLSGEDLARHDARIAATTPIDGRLGDPMRDLAPLMVFLATPGARYITGQVLVCDGGRTMVR